MGKSILASILAAAYGISAFGSAPPDFSGVWVRVDVPPTPGILALAVSMDNSYRTDETLVIRQTTDTITLRRIESQRGRRKSQEEVYILNGSEYINPKLSAATRYYAGWYQDRLVVDKTKMARNDLGLVSAQRYREEWWISDNGKILRVDIRDLESARKLSIIYLKE